MPRVIEWSDLELETLLGEGQAGKVWRAKLNVQYRDFPIGSLVAVKCYKNWVLEQPGQFERIIREVEIGRRITHPNLVKTLSLIRDPEGKPALVMPYYAGETLEDYLKKARREQRLVNVAFGFKILGDLAAAIDAVHKADAIHRDVKPANIILNGDNLILMDLGVISSKDFPEQTTSGAFMGTIRYAAPEYLFGEEYNSSIDLYALGAITYELFENTLFPCEEIQWARLIVKKQMSRIHANYDSLTDKYGVMVAELIYYILGHTLTYPSERLIDLTKFVAAMRKHIWERPWYVVNHELIEGEQRVRYLGDWEEQSATVPLKNAVDKLKSNLSEQDLSYLHKLLDKYYFGQAGKFSHLYDPTDSFTSWEIGERCDNLIAAGAIRQHGHDGYNPDHEVHESILAAYRLGYL